ncbi:MAG: ATP-binding cassette domain-containing protein [Butyricicoccus sp.]
MLEFQSVVFQYDSEDFNIIDGLSFHLEKGEFVSVIGPSGCGKSTIFRLTNQLLPRRSGEILVDGKSIDGRRGYCGYMPQRDLLFPWRTVNENLRLPMEIRGGIARRWTSVWRKRLSTLVCWLGRQAPGGAFRRHASACGIRAYAADRLGTAAAR